jgi:hypothetical protein
MPSIKRKSDWKFNTSSTGEVSAGIVGAGGGSIDFIGPGGDAVKLHYVSVGAGLALGLKTPGNVNWTYAPGFYPNAGEIYILDSFNSYELTRSDLTGACDLAEVGAGVFWGVSGSVMLLGMSILTTALEIQYGTGFPNPMSPFGVWGWVLDKVLDKVYPVSANAMLIVAGATTYTGAGISEFRGIVW